MTINVLCLHGCCQTAAMFKDILKHLERIGAQQDLKFFYLEANFDHPNGGKTWFYPPLNVADIGKIPYDPVAMMPTLLDLDAALSSIIKNENIDVLLGFSQGGNLVDTYLNYFNVVVEREKKKKIRCAIILSGYSFVDDKRSVKLDIPLLNVLSKTDEIVPYRLAPSMYNHITILEHDKGHKTPTSKPQLREIVQFIVEKSKN